MARLQRAVLQTKITAVVLAGGVRIVAPTGFSVDAVLGRAVMRPRRVTVVR
jgi:hypothetical protein